MNEAKPQSAARDSNGPQRRRSPRLSSPPQTHVKVDKMAPSAHLKRSIVVKKIAPRKTVAPSEHDKENNVQQKKAKISTPVPGRVPSPKQQQQAALLASPVLASPVLASSPALPPQPAADPRDLVWSQKVRRSYSRLSDQSVSSPEDDDDDKLFGFENLKTPTVNRVRAGQSRTGPDASGSLSGFGSFTSLLLEAEDGAPSSFLEPDPNIPGVPLAKQRRRRRNKVQQLDVVELDALAAKMNAEFEEAEGFDLFVE